MELLQLIIIDALFAAVPAVGFTMVFNVPKKMLIYCAIGGAFAHSLRFLLMDLALVALFIAYPQILTILPSMAS